MDNADKAIIKWIATKHPSPTRNYSKHNNLKCTPKNDSIESVNFGTGYGGYCETCSYEFPALHFYAECVCGKESEKLSWEIDLGYDGGLATILNEILELEAQDS